MTLYYDVAFGRVLRQKGSQFLIRETITFRKPQYIFDIVTRSRHTSFSSRQYEGLSPLDPFRIFVVVIIKSYNTIRVLKKPDYAASRAVI